MHVSVPAGVVNPSGFVPDSSLGVNPDRQYQCACRNVGAGLKKLFQNSRLLGNRATRVARTPRRPGAEGTRGSGLKTDLPSKAASRGHLLIFASCRFATPTYNVGTTHQVHNYDRATISTRHGLLRQPLETRPYIGFGSVPEVKGAIPLFSL